MAINTDEPKLTKTIEVKYTEYGEYRYFASFLVSFGYRGAPTTDADNLAVKKIWFDGELVFDLAADRVKSDIQWWFRPGTEDQTPIEPSTLAYRGQILIWFRRIDLGTSGTLPTVSAELEDGTALTLGTILANTAVRAGYNSNAINIDPSLDEIAVTGYLVDGQGTLDSVSTGLEFLYNYQMTEVNGVVTFTYSYDGDGDFISSFTIPEEKLAVIREKSEGQQIDVIEVSPDQNLPRSLSASYYDIDQNYDQGNQTASRNSFTNSSQSDVGMSLPIVATGAEIRSRLFDALYRSWESRNSHTLRLPPQYMDLDVGDGITFTAYGTEYSGVVVKATLNGDLSTTASLTERLATYEPVEVDSQPPATPLPLVGYWPINHAIFDIPDTEEDQVSSGYLNLRVALGGLTPNAWAGGRLDFANSTQPGNWNSVLSLDSDQEIGIGAIAEPLAPDATSIVVALQNFSVDRFDTADSGELLAGKNRILVGKGGFTEILQFANFTIIGDTVELTDLSRGQFGTEDFINSHSVGDPVCFLEDVITITYPLSVYTNFESYYVRPVASFQRNDEAEVTLYQPLGNSRKPYSPNNVEAVRLLNGDVKITWENQPRFTGLNDVGFTLDFYNSDWSALVRRVPYTTLTEFTYFIEEQTFDGVDGDDFTNVLVFGFNTSHVGRGFPGGGTIPHTAEGILSGTVGPLVGVTGDLDVYTGESGVIGPIVGVEGVLTGGTGLQLVEGTTGGIVGVEGDITIPLFIGTTGGVAGPEAFLSISDGYPLLRGREIAGWKSGTGNTNINLDNYDFVEGDLMVLHLYKSGASGSPIVQDFTSQGWTFVERADIATQQHSAVWVKPWEPNDTLIMSSLFPTQVQEWQVLRVANADLDNPIDDSNKGSSSSTVTTQTIAGVTTTGANRLLLSVIASTDDTLTYSPPSGMTELGEVGAIALLDAAILRMPSAAASGNKSWSLSSPKRFGGVNLAIRPRTVFLAGVIGPVSGVSAVFGSGVELEIDGNTVEIDGETVEME